MRIVTLKDLVRKDIPIYYRRLYTGVAVLELLNKPAEYRLDFAIETKPTGLKEITVNFLSDIDYPLVPLTKELKAYIDALDVNGGLPD
jgi:hypothetical protein